MVIDKVDMRPVPIFEGDCLDFNFVGEITL
jgi:hypothetical protein